MPRSSRSNPADLHVDHEYEARIKKAPIEFDTAISYVTTIKTRFAKQPKTYKAFLDARARRARCADALAVPGAEGKRFALKVRDILVASDARTRGVAHARARCVEL